MQSCLSNKADTALTRCTTSIISFKQALSKRGEVWSPYTSVQLNIADANSQVLFLGTRGCCLVYWKEENDWLQVYYLMKATVAMTTPWLLSKHGSCTIASMAIVNAVWFWLVLVFSVLVLLLLYPGFSLWCSRLSVCLSVSGRRLLFPENLTQCLSPYQQWFLQETFIN